MKISKIKNTGPACLPLYSDMALLFSDPNTGRSWAEDAPLKIGVLAIRGPQQCLASWSPTAEYLTRQVAGRRFVIVPLAHDQIYSRVQNGEVDFILANSATLCGAGVLVSSQSHRNAERAACQRCVHPLRRRHFLPQRSKRDPQPERSQRANPSWRFLNPRWADGSWPGGNSKKTGSIRTATLKHFASTKPTTGSWLRCATG